MDRARTRLLRQAHAADLGRSLTNAPCRRTSCRHRLGPALASAGAPPNSRRLGFLSMFLIVRSSVPDRPASVDREPLPFAQADRAEPRRGRTEMSAVRLSRLSAAARIARAASANSPGLSAVPIRLSAPPMMRSMRSGIVGERLAEDLDVLERGAQCLVVVGDEAVELAQHVARRLGDVRRSAVAVGLERIVRRRRRLVGAAAQRDGGVAGQTLVVEPDPGVGAHRGALVDRDDGDDLARGAADRARAR